MMYSCNLTTNSTSMYIIYLLELWIVHASLKNHLECLM